MKRRVFLPSADRFVTVEDGTVRDLDGNELGEVGRFDGLWFFTPLGALRYSPYRTRAGALAALLADPSCPTPGPNRYDRPR